MDFKHYAMAACPEREYGERSLPYLIRKIEGEVRNGATVYDAVARSCSTMDQPKVMAVLRATLQYCTGGAWMTVIGWEHNTKPSKEDWLLLIQACASLVEHKATKPIMEYSEGVITLDIARKKVNEQYAKRRSEITDQGGGGDLRVEEPAAEEHSS